MSDDRVQQLVDLINSYQVEAADTRRRLLEHVGNLEKSYSDLAEEVREVGAAVTRLEVAVHGSEGGRGLSARADEQEQRLGKAEVELQVGNSRFQTIENLLTTMSGKIDSLGRHLYFLLGGVAIIGFLLSNGDKIALFFK